MRAWSASVFRPDDWLMSQIGTLLEEMPLGSAWPVTISALGLRHLILTA